MGKESILCGLFLLGITAASGKMLVSLPSLMEAGATSQACLILQDMITDEGLPTKDQIQGMYTVRIAATYKDVNLAEQVELTIESLEYQNCFPIRAPSEAGKFDIQVVLSVLFQNLNGENEIRDLIVQDGSVTVRVIPLITLIQTDKPIYKPGQTVKFRVMTVDYELTPKTDNYSLITIKAPNGLLIRQWKDVAAPSGLISLEMPLSSDPVLGGWEIKATYGTEDTHQIFTVDEYVLPKFEVTVTPPTYLLPTSRHISGTVCAKYTYGKPVEGELRMSICYQSMYSYYGDYNKRPCGSIIQAINGCYEFFLDADDIHLMSRNYSSYGELVITANVTELQTGIMLSGTSRGPRMTMDPLNIRVEDDSDGIFKPGFPYKARVKVTNPDGTPAPGESLLIYADASDKGYVWNSTVTTDDDGIVYFAINDLVKGIGHLSIRVKTLVYGDDWRYNFDSGLSYGTYPPTGYHSITEWYSPSDNFIYIPDVDEAADCGTTLPLDVYYTADPGTDYTFLSIVRAGDNIATADKTVIKQSDIAYVLEVPVNDYMPLDREEVPIPPTMYPEFPIVPPRPEPYLPPLAKRSVDEEIQKHRMAHFILKVPIEHNYSPSVKLLLMYMRNDGEVVASSIQFNIKGCFRNEAKLTFAESTVRPGANVDYTLMASRGSTCFVGMVDKSVILLGGDNQLAPKQVFEKVGEVSRAYFYESHYQADADYCSALESSRGEAKNEWEHYSWLRPVGEDSMTAFRDVNVFVITDGTVMSRPCKREQRYYQIMYSKTGAGRPGPGEPGLRGPVQMELNSVDVQEETTEKVSTAPKVERIRSFFPETWLWDIVSLGENDEELTVQTTIPDTITEWVGNTVCTNPNDGVGVSDIVGVTAFQPFFVSLTLPYSAIRGETLPVVVTVFNYLTECIPMELSFRDTEGFQFRGNGPQSRQFCLCGGKSESAKFYIIPTIIGEIDIEVTAVAVENSGICTDVVISDLRAGVSDGVQRQLLIEAEGVPEELTWSSYMCLKDGETDSKVAKWLLPQDMVPDSFRAKFSVVGDIMGPALSNLKNLLRMPYGCGEQNMASWAPNIYVLQYLSSTNQLTPEIEEEAKNYMSVGYQRQLKYRHVDNSYSAWGENEFNNATGSSWLTAFVVKSMAQSSAYITIDTQDLASSATWLVEKQDDNGCFPKYGKVFSSYMKGGLANGDNLPGMTAFTLIALIDANLGDEFEPAINNGLECLDGSDIQTTDTYTLTLMLYVYSRRDVGSARRAEVMDELQRRKIVKDGLVHWKREETEEEPKPYFYWYRAMSAEVEMTAYVLLSMLEEGGESLNAESQLIVQWLMKQRNPYGGFSSTQDTVVALQTLAKFGSMTYSGESSVEVKVSNSANQMEFMVTPDNSLVTQFGDIGGDETEVNIEATGTGCVLAQVNMKYNVYKEEDSGPAFAINVEVYRSRTDKNNCAMRTLSVCARYLKSAVSNMAIAEVKMPTGWVPVKNSLTELVKENKVQSMEVDKNYVQLYFDELTNTDTCVTFEVEQDIRMNPKDALVKVYDYYEVSYSVTTNYNIKTTCGTKEEIPLDNEGIDCTIMQCRVDLPSHQQMSCPDCLTETVTQDVLTQLTCESVAVYKAVVGREGQYSMKMKANLRNKDKVTYTDFFANYKIGEQCSCPILEGPETRALIFMENPSIDTDSEVVTIRKTDTVVPYQRKYESAVRRLSSRRKLCAKLQRLRRSGTRKSMSKFKTLLMKNRIGV